MKKFFLTVLIGLFSVTIFSANILFDYTKAETASNADWVIDRNYPVPSPSNPSSESDWDGAISAWGYGMYLGGHTCHTLTTSYGITYGDNYNDYDLSYYDIFVVCEPQYQFTSSEKTAILNFVNNGGGLFIVADHDTSDRNGSGWDSPHIWNDLGINQYFGMHFQVDDENNDNFTYNSTRVSSDSSDPIIHGIHGNVLSFAFHKGAAIVLNTLNNSTAEGHIWQDSSHNYIMFATAEYGSGKVCAVGDSSPADDGTGNLSDDLYYGWDEGSDGEAFLNGMEWLLSPNCSSSDTTAPDWTSSGIAGLNITPGDGQLSLSWNNATDSENPNNIKYALYRDTLSSFTPNISTQIDTGLTSTTYLDTGLANGTTYYYRIMTYNCNSNSRYNTDEAAGRPKGLGPCDTDDITAPDWTVTGIANLTITNSTASSITLSWSAATDSENTDSITYDVYRDISTVNTQTSSLIASNLSVTTFTNINLLQNVNYHYRVLTKNCVPLSRLCSDEVIGTPSANNNTEPPAIEIKIYPNPFNLNNDTTLFIESNEKITDISIYDLDGNKRFNFSDLNKVGDTTFTLALETISSGIYLMIITTDNPHISKLFIVK
ncbi:T9SS type A sorting domain-containing protein [bacterium]|nr:T9SS type A sorting domain-containing protein [bacterium]